MPSFLHSLSSPITVEAGVVITARSIFAGSSESEAQQGVTPMYLYFGLTG